MALIWQAGENSPQELWSMLTLKHHTAAELFAGHQWWESLVPLHSKSRLLDWVLVTVEATRSRNKFERIEALGHNALSCWTYPSADRDTMVIKWWTRVEFKTCSIGTQRLSVCSTTPSAAWNKQPLIKGRMDPWQRFYNLPLSSFGESVWIVCFLFLVNRNDTRCGLMLL